MRQVAPGLWTTSCRPCTNPTFTLERRRLIPLSMLGSISWKGLHVWRIFAIKKKARFPLAPKCHMLFHVVHKMKVQIQLVGFLENPIMFSTASDEDFIGRYCYLTRCVSPRQRILRSIQRYLTQVYLFWVRKRWWCCQGGRWKWCATHWLGRVWQEGLYSNGLIWLIWVVCGFNLVEISCFCSGLS